MECKGGGGTEEARSSREGEGRNLGGGRWEVAGVDRSRGRKELTGSRGGGRGPGRPAQPSRARCPGELGSQIPAPKPPGRRRGGSRRRGGGGTAPGGPGAERGEEPPRAAEGGGRRRPPQPRRASRERPRRPLSSCADLPCPESSQPQSSPQSSREVQTLLPQGCKPGFEVDALFRKREFLAKTRSRPVFLAWEYFLVQNY